MLAIDVLGHGLVGGKRAGEDPRAGVGDSEKLEKPLDAAILSIAAVKRHEGNVVPTVCNGVHEVLVGDVIEVYLGKPAFEKSLGARLPT